MAMYTFVMLSVEKFIAIKFALRYKAIVTHRRVYKIIAAGWITIPLLKLTGLIYELIVSTEYDKFSRFGFCFIKQGSYLVLFSTHFPIFLAFSITIILDAYLSIKAYQVYKRIQKENGEEKQMSKSKLNKILKQLKPMITLLVTGDHYHSSNHGHHLCIISDSRGNFVSKACRIVKFTLSQFITASTGVWSLLYKDSLTIVQEVETHGSKLQLQV